MYQCVSHKQTIKFQNQGLFRIGQAYSARSTISTISFIGAPNTDEGARALTTALQVLQHLGVPVAEHKMEGPSTSGCFLGILIDTRNLELRLPREKIERLRTLLQSWQAKKACKRKELESFLGHLSHACISSASWPHLPPTIVQPVTPGKGTASLCPVKRSRQGRHHLVALLSAGMEWYLLLPPARPILPCILRCVRYFWLWSICGKVRVVPSTVARGLAGA